MKFDKIFSFIYLIFFCLMVVFMSIFEPFEINTNVILVCLFACTGSIHYVLFAMVKY